MMLTFVNVIWGALCGKTTRRVLLGETRTRGHAYSVRRRRESACDRKAPHRLKSSRLVSTNLFDLWVNVWRTKWAQGEVVVIRYADDTIVGFQYRADADRFLANLRERLAMFGLELHPDKTRRIEFGRYAEENRKRRGEGKPETFDFLGFTHISGKNSLGRFAVRRKTIRKRMRAKLRRIKPEFRKRMHDPLSQTGQWLKSIVQGYFNYYAVPGNTASLSLFRHRLLVHWWHSVRRRSQKHRISWTRMLALGKRWLPDPQVLHPFPDARFAVNHPR